MDWLVRGSYRLLRWLRVKDAAVKVAGVDLMLHTLYLLTCYISAHEAVQHEVEEVYGAEGTYFADEAAVVKKESSEAIEHAKRYLDRLRRIDVPLSAPGNPPTFAPMEVGQLGGQAAPQLAKGQPVPLPASGRLADGVRAKQAAHLILFWLESYVHELHHEGCLDLKLFHGVPAAVAGPSMLVAQLEHDACRNGLPTSVNEDEELETTRNELQLQPAEDGERRVSKRGVLGWQMQAGRGEQ